MRGKIVFLRVRYQPCDMLHCTIFCGIVNYRGVNIATWDNQPDTATVIPGHTAELRFTTVKTYIVIAL